MKFFEFKDATRSEDQAEDFARELNAVIQKHSPSCKAFVLTLSEDEQLIYLSSLKRLGAAGMLTDILGHILHDEHTSRKAQAAEEAGKVLQ